MRWVAVSALVALGACMTVSAGNPRIAAAYGFDNEAEFQGAVLSITKEVNRFNCGRAMTQAACAATQANVLALVPQNLDQIKADAIASILRKNGGSEEAAIAAVRAQSATDQARPLCVGPVTVQCAGLFDAMFGGGALLPVLEQARAQANRQVPQFYRDGRPFDG